VVIAERAGIVSFFFGVDDSAEDILRIRNFHELVCSSSAQKYKIKNAGNSASHKEGDSGLVD
jgi:hypothetical protein